ncbi:phospholysine phosphohistidine inorganic pyrophosphate phosphatase [Lepeophtheirus salmonis]|uniref:Phospholysine phosphohistidine inorganic pyrophosphate phosphatase n=2 Tax=Lepeophtheirus salmonis TaxID=72036 RepID=D3PH32_LEPSM|nr:phospholysine phosphohistidine inorganic pyrophosphate phosphatase-like [Lepeophtheirus salmonis]ADD24578.1 Phospholysine phosphohistidine inorganic pyrophosphate phosphatase [Lepeophtheirus salmonis]
MTTLKDQGIQGVLLDITGVLIESSSDGQGKVIPGSVEAIQLLRKENVPFRFLTNETTKSRSQLLESLHAHGYEMDETQIFTPAIAANTLILREGLNPLLLAKESVYPDLKDISSRRGEKDSVLLADFEEGFYHANMNKAFRVLIKDPSRQLFTLGKGKFYKHDEDLSLDVGPFAVALEYATDRQARIIGKPDASFFLEAVKDMGLSPGKGVVMVGDDVRSDVKGSQEAGLSGVLVRTGKYRPVDETIQDIHPDAVVDNLLSFVKKFI